MGLFEMLFSSRDNRHLVNVAQEAARRSCSPVWSRVQHNAVDMSQAEARGYIRARCADVVAGEVAAAMTKHPRIAERFRPLLIATVKTSLVDTLVAEVVRAQRTLGYRRAA